MCPIFFSWEKDILKPCFCLMWDKSRRQRQIQEYRLKQTVFAYLLLAKGKWIRTNVEGHVLGLLFFNKCNKLNHTLSNIFGQNNLWSTKYLWHRNLFRMLNGVSFSGWDIDLVRSCFSSVCWKLSVNSTWPYPRKIFQATIPSYFRNLAVS